MIFCSRTHSQCSQFVSELRRTTGFSARLLALPLAARRALCINPAVRALGAAHLINERWEELQQVSGRCGGRWAMARGGGAQTCAYLTAGTQP